MTYDFSLSLMENYRLHQEQVKIKAKTPGILKLSPGEFGTGAVGGLVKKMVARGKTIGNQAVSRAIQNLVRWNKKQNPKLSAKAKKVADGFSKAIAKEA